jgi:hypothetical protein
MDVFFPTRNVHNPVVECCIYSYSIRFSHFRHTSKASRTYAMQKPIYQISIKLSNLCIQIYDKTVECFIFSDPGFKCQPEE